VPTSCSDSKKVSKVAKGHITNLSPFAAARIHRILTPIKYTVPETQKSQPPKRHIDRLSHFSTEHPCGRQWDRLTDQAVCDIRINRLIDYVHYANLFDSCGLITIRNSKQQVCPSSGTDVYPHMSIVCVASALDESAIARVTRMIKPPHELCTDMYPILGFWGSFRPWPPSNTWFLEPKRVSPQAAFWLVHSFWHSTSNQQQSLIGLIRSSSTMLSPPSRCQRESWNEIYSANRCLAFVIDIYTRSGPDLAVAVPLRPL